MFPRSGARIEIWDSHRLIFLFFTARWILAGTRRTKKPANSCARGTPGHATRNYATRTLFFVLTSPQYPIPSASRLAPFQVLVLGVTRRHNQLSSVFAATVYCIPLPFRDAPFRGSRSLSAVDMCHRILPAHYTTVMCCHRFRSPWHMALVVYFRPDARTCII